MTTTPTPAPAAPTPAPAATPAMPLSTKAKIDFAIAILLFIAFVVLGRTWLAEHDARLKAEATVSQQQKLAQQASDQVKQLQDADKAHDAQTADAIAKITAAAAAVKTPQQITNWIPAQFAKAPEPIQSSIAPATPQNPTPPTVITVPQPDLSFLKDQITSCQRNTVALSGAQQDLSSCQAQAKLLNSQIADRDKQIAALNQELKGGTFWHRLKSGMKKVGIGILVGAAIGAVAVCKTGHCK